MDLLQGERPNLRAIRDLRDAVAEDDAYDCIVIDCPPALSPACAAAIAASTDVVIPIKVDAYSVRGMNELTAQIDRPPEASTSAAKQARETAPDSGDDDGPWHWWPEQPQKSGLYWCITGPMSQGGSLYWWSAEKERWEHAAMAFPLSPTVTIWMRCPQLPESMDWERQEDPNGEE